MILPAQNPSVYPVDMQDVAPKPGRPPLHGRATLAVRLQVRVLRAERTAWEKAARREGKSLSEWVREVVNRAVAGQ